MADQYDLVRSNDPVRLPVSALRIEQSTPVRGLPKGPSFIPKDPPLDVGENIITKGGTYNRPKRGVFLPDAVKPQAIELSLPPRNTGGARAIEKPLPMPAATERPLTYMDDPDVSASDKTKFTTREYELANPGPTKYTPTGLSRNLGMVVEGGPQYLRDNEGNITKLDHGQISGLRGGFAGLKPPTLSEKAQKMGAVSDFWANMGLKGPDEYVATRSKQEGDVYKARLEAEAAKNQLAMQERLRTDALEKTHQEHRDRVGLREAMVGARQADDAAKAADETRDRRAKNLDVMYDRFKKAGLPEDMIPLALQSLPMGERNIEMSTGLPASELNLEHLSAMVPSLKSQINAYRKSTEGVFETDFGAEPDKPLPNLYSGLVPMNDDLLIQRVGPERFAALRAQG